MNEAEETEFHSDTVRRSLLDRLAVLRPSWNTCKNMRIVTRTRLPGPIDRGWSERYTVYYSDDRNRESLLKKKKKKNLQSGNEFFFFFEIMAWINGLRLLYLETRGTVTGYVRRGCRVLNASASGLMVKSRWERKKYESDRYVDTYVRMLRRARFAVGDRYYDSWCWRMFPSQCSGEQHRMG